MSTQSTETSATWQTERIERLMVLWTEGHSVAEIGRRLGVSKNAVVGKAHRLHLLGRPHPIRSARPKGATPIEHRARDGSHNQLPAFAGNRSTTATPVEPPRANIKAPPAPVTPPTVPPPPARRPPSPRAVPPLNPLSEITTVVRLNRCTTCAWPIGDPSTSSFRFCDAQPLTGKPYCGEHAAIAYVPRIQRKA